MTEQSNKDWENIRFGSRSHRPAAESAEDRAQSRFVVGIAVFLGVALAYPWYAYWVNARITLYALEVATQELGREAQRADAEARSRQVAASEARSTADRSRRIDAVRVVGATRTRNGPVAIVQLGDATAGEAAQRICRQAEGLLREPLDGETLRVQRHRGAAPALDVGRVRC